MLSLFTYQIRNVNPAGTEFCNNADCCINFVSSCE